MDGDRLLLRGGGIVVHIERVRGGVIVPMRNGDGQPAQPGITVPVELLSADGRPQDAREALLAAAAKAADEIDRLRREWGES